MTKILTRILGPHTVTVLACMLSGAIVITFVMVFGSTIEPLHPIYPERLFFQIFGWFVSGAAIASGIVVLFLHKKRFDYPPDEENEFSKMEYIERVTTRNNKIRIALTVIIVVAGIVNQWIYDLPFGSVFYLVGISLCVILELINQVVIRTLK